MESPTTTSGAGKFVLVVEDEPVMNELVAEVLRFKGFEVRGVLTGEDALTACEERLPDAVLLDLMLPGISGYEVCHQLKCSRRTNLVPVLMLTALDRRDDQVRGIRVGADAYLTKPFEPEELARAILATIEKVGQARARGLQGHLEVSFQSDLSYLTEVNELLLGLYSQSPLGEEEIQQIRYCLLELGRNAVEWGNRNDPHLMIYLDYTLTAEELTVRIRDQGRGFNPADVPHAAHDGDDALAHTFVREKLGLRDGGFGILLSRKFMDEVTYNPQGNEVTARKRFRK
jgi:DNA-binding response OmpR family regulator